MLSNCHRNISLFVDYSDVQEIIVVGVHQDFLFFKRQQVDHNLMMSLQ